MTKAARLAVVLAALALLAAGCSGEDGGAEDAPGTGAATTTVGTTTEGAAAPLDGGTPDDAPGRTLLAFVRAAERADARAMWNLLSEPTRASIGPTFDDFRRDKAIAFQTNLGSLAPTAKVILSRRLPDDWSVAAIAGESEIGGEREYFAYGAAMLLEDGSLKLDLGGVVITGYRPEPVAVVDETQPLIAANVGAGGDLMDVRMWLDGEPFPARRGANDTPFTASLRGRPEQPLAAGRHEVVVFAATSETATSTAWTFTVEPTS